MEIGIKEEQDEVEPIMRFIKQEPPEDDDECNTFLANIKSEIPEMLSVCPEFEKLRTNSTSSVVLPGSQISQKPRPDINLEYTSKGNVIDDFKWWKQERDDDLSQDKLERNSEYNARCNSINEIEPRPQTFDMQDGSHVNYHTPEVKHVFDNESIGKFIEKSDKDLATDNSHSGTIHEVVGKGEGLEELLQCTFCENTLSKSQHKAVHEQSQVGEEQVRCEHYVKTCSQINNKKRFPYLKKTSLKNSKNVVQKVVIQKVFNEKPCQCTPCHRTLSQMYHKTMHEAIQLVAKPYHCNYCEERFLKNSSKVKHERMHMNKKKPYKCTFCQKMFPRISNKLVHEWKCH